MNPLIFPEGAHRLYRDYRTVSSVSIHLEHKFVYLRVPKAANSTILNQLYFVFSDTQVPKNIDRKTYLSQVWMRDLSSLTWAQGRSARKDYFFFTFVRDPYSRTLSAFLNKLQWPRYINLYGNRIKKFSDSREIDFTGFCRFLKEGGGLRLDRHWRPQTDFIWPAIDRLDYIGKFESLEDSFRELMDMFGASGRNMVRSSSDLDFGKHFGPKRTDASTKKCAMFTNECKEICNELYAGDFEAFSYLVQ